MKEVLEGAKFWLSSVRLLGPVTVAFFMLLVFLMYTQVTASADIQMTHNNMNATIERVEEKVDRAWDNDALVLYYLRKICEHGAETDLQKQSCTPPPSQTYSAN